MNNLAVKIAVWEFEKGWGSKIDDWKVCLTTEDANKFKEEFNAKNNLSQTPDWYMVIKGDPEPITLDNKQFNQLKSEKRMWLSVLSKVK